MRDEAYLQSEGAFMLAWLDRRMGRTDDDHGPEGHWYQAPGIDDQPDFAPPVTEHRYSIDTDTCVCGGGVVYFEDGDKHGNPGEGCESANEVWPDTCGICGERIRPSQEKGEMYDPDDPRAKSQIVHAECGLAVGWEIA